MMAKLWVNVFHYKTFIVLPKQPHQPKGSPSLLFYGHSLLSAVEVKNEKSYTYTPPYVLIA
jgi:hypothetical protein